MKRLLISARIEYLDHAWKYFVNESYLQALQYYDVECFCPLRICDFSSVAKHYDGLLLCGGYDITPCYFHETADKQAKLYEKPVDFYDFQLMDAFVKAKKPILGICRGMQIINVYFGGTLHQHFDSIHHEESPHMHPIYPKPQTIFSQLYPSSVLVNSFHHQCVKQIAHHLRIGAVAMDERIEALEHEVLPIIGVQWHPEKLEDDRIIPYFISLFSDASSISLFPSDTIAIQE